MFPEGLDLAVLDSVFVSWHAVTGSRLGLLTLDKLDARYEVVFKHDHYLYRSDTYISHCINKQSLERKLNIKLPNNGLIYPDNPDTTELSVFKSALTRHRPSTFVKLDRSHLSQFPHLIDFAKSYLKVPQVHCQLFYNYDNDKFDFKAFSSEDRNDGVCFSFRHFSTVDDEFDDDYWLTI